MGQAVIGTDGALALREVLLDWYDRHKRDLPWRRIRDPYAIWVSEIMLQQTRVAAVLEHYARWMERFPSVAALAAAEEPEVLALWSGLGYYRRARFLHAGARKVMAAFSGRLPRTASALRALPGIGDYTSAAIASIAFGEQAAVIDGNVERVVMRLRGFSAGDSGLGQRVRANADALLAPARPGDWNQAVMELGATVCLPRGPLCLQCPVQAWCATRGEHVGGPRKAMQSRTIAYALATRAHDGGQEVLLVQRPPEVSLMPGMWELPEVDAEASGEMLLELKHSITVTNYRVSVLACAPEQHAAILRGNESASWTPVAQLPERALTGLARKAIRRLALWPEMAAGGS